MCIGVGDDTSSWKTSFSIGPGMPYKEMAGNCEALQMGKQQKMSHLMNAQLRQESLIHFSFHNHEDEAKNLAVPSHISVGSNSVLAVGNFIVVPITYII